MGGHLQAERESSTAGRAVVAAIAVSVPHSIVARWVRRPENDDDDDAWCLV
jgi:hypothetical protein